MSYIRKFSSLSNTLLLGWPNVLFFPTPISAIWGCTASKNSCMLDVFEPWCPTFRISDFKIFVFLYSCNICLSAISSISPVKSIENFLYFNFRAIELLFKIFSCICFSFGHKIWIFKFFSINISSPLLNSNYFYFLFLYYLLKSLIICTFFTLFANYSIFYV